MNALDQGWAAYRGADYASARTHAYTRLHETAQDADAWLLLAAAWRAEGHGWESEAAYRRGCELSPERAELWLNLGHLLRSQARPQEAVEAYRRGIAQAPAFAGARVALCEAFIQAAQPEQAAEAARQALADGLDAIEIHQALGNALFSAGQIEAALGVYEGALARAPENTALRYNAALAHARLGRRDTAIDHLDRLLALAPATLNAHIKRGDLLKDAGDATGAEHAYRHALALSPRLAEVHNNLGAALARQNRWKDAILAYRMALECGLRAPVLYMNLGNAHHALRELDAALAAYREGLTIAPDDLPLLTEAVHVQQKLCDWRGFEHLQTRLIEPSLAWQGEGVPPSPFVFVALPAPVTPAQQRQVASRYAQHLASLVPAPTPTRRHRPPGPLRIGYVSADFHNHATAHLMLGLFRRHDRARVSVHAYSFGPDDGSEYRRRIVADCDRFTELGAVSDAQAAARIRADDIDIVVDLKGYTGSARPALFAWRPAPLAVQWLGYPGTLGADWIDYIVADRSVLPESDLPHYTEAPVWMPGSYQPNDCEQPIATTVPSRAQCGLPEHGFVFCCFNSPYKIEPRIFALWLDLLRELPGSVLWLYAGNDIAADNLCREAAARGMDPARLVFARALPKAEHLARHTHADLFLDTLYYNAHTTASDALWAGVPVVTTPGASFASRVAAGLLRACGLPELIAPDLTAYRDLALSLARDPERLAALKAKLLAVRPHCALFDTAAFARHLETAFETMWARHAAGQPPAPIRLE